MSTGPSYAMDALPRASFLTYFRRSNPRRTSHYRCHPPQYSKCSAQVPSLPRIVEAESEDTDTELDEESQLGFWGEGPPPKYEASFEGDRDESESEEEGYGWGFYEVACLVCYMLLILFLVVNIDTFLERTGISAGLMEKHESDMESPQLEGREMHFCLGGPDRDAPTSRVWRFMPIYSLEDCATQIVTLQAGPTEEWKMLPGDEVLLGDDQSPEDGNVGTDKFISISQSEGDDYVTHDSLGEDFGYDLVKGEKRQAWREAATDPGFQEQ